MGQMQLSPFELIGQFAELQARALPFALVTVVHTGGQKSRRLGTKMFVLEDGTCVGSVGYGSCKDQDIQKNALRAIAEQTPLILELGEEDPDSLEGGLSCSGHFTVLIEPVEQVFESWNHALNLLLQRQSCVLITDLKTLERRVSLDLSRCPETVMLSGNLLLERWTPEIQLLVVGQTQVSHILLKLASSLGYAAQFYDPAQHSLTKLDPHTALVVTSHNYAEEIEVLSEALQSEAGYLAVLSSQRRASTLRTYLQDLGLQNTDRIHGPAGFDLGSNHPSTIALGILAELTQTLYRSKASETFEIALL